MICLSKYKIMITEEYINESRLLGDVVSIDPVRYRKNEKKTPVVNAIVETVRKYPNGVIRYDQHKLALFGDRALDFYDTVMTGDKVFISGYMYNRQRTIKNENGPDIEVIEATLTVENFIMLSQTI